MMSVIQRISFTENNYTNKIIFNSNLNSTQVYDIKNGSQKTKNAIDTCE